MISMMGVLMSLSIFSILMIVSASFINVEAINQMGERDQIASGVARLSNAYLTFRHLHRQPPSALNELFPGVISEPELPYGLEWAYDEASKSWVCITGDITEERQWAALVRVASSMPAQDTILSASCGSSSEFEPEDYPTTVALTYRVAAI